MKPNINHINHLIYCRKRHQIFSLLFLIQTFILVPVASQMNQQGEDQTSSLPGEIDYREKIFLHTDRKLYLSGEVIWFKGYCTYRDLNILSDVSRVLYVEILNNQNNPVLSEKIMLKQGTGHGTISLPRSMQTGIYYIRAYTRWMTNFPPEFFFYDRLYIVNPFTPIKTIIRENEPADFKLDFFTDKKQLIPGQRNEIAFHAVYSNGQGVNLTGWLINRNGDTISALNSWKYGYGLFTFFPEWNEEYKVITLSQDQRWKENPLPFEILHKPLQKESSGDPGIKLDQKLTITLRSDKVIYSPREKITLTIDTRDPAGGSVNANMSVSVYKSENPVGFNHKSISQYLNHSAFLPVNLKLPDDQFRCADYDSDTLNRILNVIYSCLATDIGDKGISSDFTYILPETRGQSLTGTVYNVSDRNPASLVKVYVAQPGKTSQVYASTSSGYGRFQVRLLDQYGRNDVIVMPGEDPDNYYIMLDDDFSGDYCTFNPEVFQPDEMIIEYIRRLMINLQVEDAFGIYPLHEDDISKYALHDIYGDPDESIYMADFIKLPAVEEVFTELVKTVLIRRKRNNNFELQIIDPATKMIVPGEPLLLLDGVPVLDINPIIIYMDPGDLEKIDVITSRFIQGNEVYPGIINMVTKQADYHHFDLPSYAVRKPYQFFQVPRTFRQYQYSADNDSLRSIPDFRNLLYWNPEVVTGKNGSITVTFYAADEISDYRIVIQGLSEEGLPGSAEGIISVKE